MTKECSQLESCPTLQRRQLGGRLLRWWRGGAGYSTQLPGKSLPPVATAAATTQVYMSHYLHMWGRGAGPPSLYCTHHRLHKQTQTFIFLHCEPKLNFLLADGTEIIEFPLFLSSYFLMRHRSIFSTGLMLYRILFSIFISACNFSLACSAL